MQEPRHKISIYRQLSSYLPVVFILILSFLLPQCAQIVAPTGGPKDTIPPVLLSVTPVDSTLNFHSGEIVLNFDEFIQLKNLQDEMIISPNPWKTPEIKTKLRTLTIKWDNPDSLQSNTTYIINMGNAIEDLNEGNKFRDYKYVFSTGNYLDSLEITGNVIDAQTGLPDTAGSVMLYTKLSDSVVTREKPTYYSRLDGKGAFRFQNLPHGLFKVFAIQENKGDLKYTDTSKMIGFLNHPVRLDSNASGIVLSLFKEDPDMAARLDKHLTVRTSLDFGRQKLNKPLILTFNHLLKSLDSGGIHLETDTLKQDTAFLPVEFQLKRKDDSLNTVLTLEHEWKENASYRLILDSAFATDLSDSTFAGKDTLTFRTERKVSVKQPKKEKKKEEEGKIEKKKELELTTSLKSGKQELNQPLTMTFSDPIDSLDSTGITLQEGKDFKTIPFDFVRDTSARVFRLKYNWKQETPYRLMVDSAFARDTAGLAYPQKDTISFTTKSNSDYGILILHFDTTNLFKIGDQEEAFVFGKFGRPSETTSIKKPDRDTVRQKSDTISIKDSSGIASKDTVLPGDEAPQKANLPVTEDTTGISADSLKRDSLAALPPATQEAIPDSFQLVVELYKGKDLIARSPVTGNTWRKEFLDPTEYEVRVILDTNKNGKWDSGCYYCAVKTQPEKAYSIPDKYTVRANWENDNPNIQVRFILSALQ